MFSTNLAAPTEAPYRLGSPERMRSPTRFVIPFALALALARCGGGAVGERVTPRAPEPSPPQASATASSATADAAAAVAPRPAEPAPPAAKAPFAPAAFEPPHARSAQPGDGQWSPVAAAGNVDGEPLAFQTKVHPHGIRKDHEVTIIAFDLRRAELVWMPGSKEPENKSAPAALRHGIVPAADRERLVAAFNGGFMAKHGKLGAMLEGTEFLPPREGACTIGIADDGHVVIAPWEKLASEKLHAYRQTPPCLVDAGELHPGIDSDHKRWGLSAEGKFEIRRSAPGIDGTGRVLYFGLGEWVLPRELALAMKLAGAASAAELDINWSYTRFNFYGHAGNGNGVEVTGTLIPQLVHTAHSYVGEVAERDFFYVRRKARVP